MGQNQEILGLEKLCKEACSPCYVLGLRDFVTFRDCIIADLQPTPARVT